MPGDWNIRCIAEHARVVGEEEDSGCWQELREESCRPECAILVGPRLARMIRITFRVESVDEHDTIDGSASAPCDGREEGIVTLAWARKDQAEQACLYIPLRSYVEAVDAGVLELTSGADKKIR